MPWILRCLICGVTIASTLMAPVVLGDEQEPSAILPETVRVRFVVRIPQQHDTGEARAADVFVAGNLRQLGRWKPDGLQLEPAADGTCCAEFSAPSGTRVEFKVTRGAWQTVEKDKTGRDIPNRQFEVKATTDGMPQQIAVTVERWGSSKAVKSGVTGTVVLHEQVASRHLSRARNISVWLPPGYKDSEERYPILYLHDGQNLFDATSAAFGTEWEADETATRLIADGEISPIIIVGIHNTVDRIDEYTLTHDERLERGGRGMDYLRFVAEELKPFIDRSYRTRMDRQSTLIGGSSLGGLISLHACIEKPETFGVCLAFSPSLGWDHEQLLETLESGRSCPSDVRLWFSMGTREGRDPETQASNLARSRRLHERLSATNLDSPARFHFQEFADGSHDEKSWAAQLPFALKAVLGPQQTEATADPNSNSDR